MTLIQRLTTHHALAGLAMGFFLAVQTLFLLEKGLGLWHIGVIFGTFGASAALMELPLGAVADMYGRVRIYALSRILSLIGVILMIVLDSFWTLLPAAALMGVSRALDSGSIEAWQVDQMKAEGLQSRLPTAIARFHTATALAIAFGALLGGYLPDLLVAMTPESVRPSEWNLLAQALITGVHLLLLPALFREGDPRWADDSTSGVRQQLRIAMTYGIGNLRLRGVFMTSFVIGLVGFTLEAFWQPRVTEIAPEASYSVFGWVATGYFLAAALGPMLLGLLQKRWNVAPDRTINAILMMLAPILALLAVQNQLTGFAPTYLGFMLILSMINVPFEVLMSEEVPSRVRSTLFSVLSLSMQAGGVFMAYGLSYFIQWLGIAGMWILMAGVLLTMAVYMSIRTRLAKVEPPSEEAVGRFS